MTREERIEKRRQAILRIWWDGNQYAWNPSEINLTEYADKQLALLESTLGMVALTED